MTDTTPALLSLSPADTVTHFLQALQNKDTDVFEALIDENILYQNVGLPSIRGRAGVLKAFSFMRNPNTGFEVQFHRTTTNGGTVMNERHDAIIIGPLRLQFWVCGVFDVSDRGTITLWRDYFDMADMFKATVRGLLAIPFPALRQEF